MKKILLGVAVLAAVAVTAGWFFMNRPTPRSRPVSELMPASGAAQPKREQPELPAAPLKVRFDAPKPPVLGEAVPVSLVVESNAAVWPKEIGEDCQLEFLLRLPMGVKLASEGWKEMELPPKEKNDPTGPWFIFERKVPVRIPAGSPPSVIVKEPIELSVVEPGTNWIITVRARLVSGKQAWQTFGLLLATLEGETAQFHTQPLRPTLLPQESQTGEGERAKTD